MRLGFVSAESRFIVVDGVKMAWTKLSFNTVIAVDAYNLYFCLILLLVESDSVAIQRL